MTAWQKFWLLALSCVLASVSVASAAAKEPRRALILANWAYKHIGPHPTAKADAALMAATFKRFGFEVTTAENLTRAGMTRAAAVFIAKTKKSGPKGVAFIYFSGHGVEVEGSPLMLATDFKAARGQDLDGLTVPPMNLINSLVEAHAGTSVLILDMARENLGDYKLGWPAAAQLWNNQGIAFSVRSGRRPTRPQGGQEGAFVQAFAEVAERPHLRLRGLLRETRSRVLQLTVGRQLTTERLKGALSFQINNPGQW